jgi:hypothetical protein
MRVRHALGMSRRREWQHTSINHPQPRDAEHPRLAIYNRPATCIATHSARRSTMMDRTDALLFDEV